MNPRIHEKEEDISASTLHGLAIAPPARGHPEVGEDEPDRLFTLPVYRLLIPPTCREQSLTEIPRGAPPSGDRLELPMHFRHGHVMAR